MAGKFMVLLRPSTSPQYEAAAKTFTTEAGARRFATLIESGCMTKALVVKVCDAEQQPRAGKALAASIAEKGENA